MQRAKNPQSFYLCDMSATVRYLIQYAIFLAIVAGALFAWNQTAPVYKTHPLAWGIFAFFTIAYALGHFYIQGSEGQRPAVFVRRFMATTTIRLMVFLLALTLYAFTHKPEAVLFIWHFLAFYAAFTIFEVASLSHHFRKKD